MRRISNYTIIVICFSLLFVSFIYGYFYVDRKNAQKPNNDIDNKFESNRKTKDEQDESIGINVEDDDVIGPETLIEYVTYYKKCDEYITKIERPKNEMINMNEEEFRIYIKNKEPNWTITYFSHDNIIINIVKDQLCPNHFIIGIKDDKIAIYKINEQGNQELYQIIDVPISLLKNIDQEKLKKGIVVDTEEELSDVLENFIS